MTTLRSNKRIITQITQIIHISIRYKHLNVSEKEPINRLTRSLNLEWMEKKDIAWNTNKYDPSYPIKIVSSSLNNMNDINIIKQIDETIDTKNIYNIIKLNYNKIENISIFGKAIQKCIWLKDWKIGHEIMKLAIKSNLEMNNIIFNIFLNCLAKFDHPQLCIKYFEIMINDFKIKPDNITFGTILKSFRSQLRYKDAEKIWEIMLTKFNIKPDEFIFVETMSIYSKCHQIDKANKLFNLYLNYLNNGELKLYPLIFNAYLNVFSRNGDIKGMKNVIKIIKKYNLKINESNITDLMRGYLLAKKPKKVLNLLENYINLGNIPNLQMMGIKCAAYNELIKNNKSFNEKYKLFIKLREIPNDIRKYKLKSNHSIAATQLLGAIYLYHDNNPFQIVKIFEDLLNKNLIGYKQPNKNNDGFLISFRMFLPLQTQFILRYLFAFKISDILNSIENKQDHTIKIMVGKGNAKIDKKSVLAPFIIKELKSWNPPILSYIDVNSGLLCIDKQQLIPYIDNNNNINFAKKLLLSPYKL